MKRTSALILGVVFVLSILAGATSTLAVQTSVVPVLTVDDNGQSLTVDSITVFNSDGTVAGKKTGVSSTSFVLEKGTYTIVAKKSGYKDADRDLTITDQSPSTLATSILTLQKSNEPTGGTGSGTGTGATSQDLTVDLEISEDKVAPGDVVTFDLDIENTAEYDAEEVEVTLTIKGIDEDGDDVEVEAETFDLNDEGSDDNVETISLALRVPFTAEEGEYDVIVDVEWKNEDTNEKFINQVVEENAIEVERQDHDVRVTEIILSETAVDAGNNVQVGITIFNVGLQDEDVKIRVKSTELGVDLTSGQFELDEDEETTQHMSFTVPKNTKNGEYVIQATVMFGDSESKTEFATLKVGGQGKDGVSVIPLTTTISNEFGSIGLVLGIIIALVVIALVSKEFIPASWGVRTEIIRRR